LPPSALSSSPTNSKTITTIAPTNNGITSVESIIASPTLAPGGYVNGLPSFMEPPSLPTISTSPSFNSELVSLPAMTMSPTITASSSARSSSIPTLPAGPTVSPSPSTIASTITTQELEGGLRAPTFSPAPINVPTVTSGPTLSPSPSNAGGSSSLSSLPTMSNSTSPSSTTIGTNSTSNSTSNEALNETGANETLIIDMNETDALDDPQVGNITARLSGTCSAAEEVVADDNESSAKHDYQECNCAI